jgi:GT2 family glycosyltransferase
LIKIAIAILNWNGKKYLQQFLPFLIKYSPSSISKIWIIDNASNDDSIDFIEKEYPSIGIVLLDKNYGFTGGYNKGLAEINAEYFLLLNSDIEVSENWLNPLLNIMENDKKIGVCGPKLLDYNYRNKFEYAGASGGFLDKYGYPFCRGRIFDSIETDNSQYNKNIECFWITGAALMIRANLYKSFNGFDDSFFAHMEEIDLCWRIQNANYKIMCIPESAVYHIGGGTLPKINHKKTYLNFRNNLFLLYKNLPNENLKTVFFKRFFLDQLAVVKMFLQGNYKHAASVYKAYFDFFFKINAIKKYRKTANNKPLKSLKGFYSESIVNKYFLKGINKYSEL